MSANQNSIEKRFKSFSSQIWSIFGNAPENDFNSQLQEDEEEEERKQMQSINMFQKKKHQPQFRAHMDDGGPINGHQFRARGSPKKTFKRVKIEVSEEEINNQWTQFRQMLDDIYNNDLDNMKDDSLFFVDQNLKPYLKNIEYILLEEDKNLILTNQSGTIGDCMEYAIRENIFMEVITLA